MLASRKTLHSKNELLSKSTLKMFGSDACLLFLSNLFGYSDPRKSKTIQNNSPQVTI